MPTDHAPERRTRFAPWWALAVVLALNFAVRWPLLGMPLERDEGEFAYGGQLVRAGEVPYRAMYALKWPGIYAAYALVESLFGPTARGIHLGLILVTSVNAVWMFALGTRLRDAWTGFCSAAVFVALGLSPAVQPTSNQAEHWVLACALPALYALWTAPNRTGAWLLSGVGYGLAMLMKQHGALLTLAAIAPLLTQRATGASIPARSLTLRLAKFLFGLAIPLAAAALWIARQGAFEAFWHWTVQYAFLYATNESIADGLARLPGALWQQARPVWPIFVAALVGMGAMFRPGDHRTGAANLGWLSAASLAAILPGWHFRAHYFLLAWPAVALWSACGVEAVATWLPSWAGRFVAGDAPARPAATARSRAAGAFSGAVKYRWLLTLIVAGWPLAAAAGFLLTQSPWRLSRTMYGADPFNECPAVAEYLAQQTAPHETIAVLGSQPQIYFLANRRAATGHIYMYPLTEAQPLALDMQQSMIDELQGARPRFMVMVDDWHLEPGCPRRILEWIGSTLKRDFEVVGAAEIIDRDETRFVWEADIRQHRPQRRNVIEVYRRKAP